MRVTLPAESTYGVVIYCMRKKLTPLPKATASACSYCLDLAKLTQQCIVCYPLLCQWMGYNIYLKLQKFALFLQVSAAFVVVVFFRGVFNKQGYQCQGRVRCYSF